MFLPPDLNPIEELYSKVKSVMKANEYVLEDYDLETTILCGFSSNISVDCELDKSLTLLLNLHDMYNDFDIEN